MQEGVCLVMELCPGSTLLERVQARCEDAPNSIYGRLPYTDGDKWHWAHASQLRWLWKAPWFRTAARMSRRHPPRRVPPLLRIPASNDHYLRIPVASHVLLSCACRWPWTRRHRHAGETAATLVARSAKLTRDKCLCAWPMHCGTCTMFAAWFAPALLLAASTHRTLGTAPAAVDAYRPNRDPFGGVRRPPVRKLCSPARQPCGRRLQLDPRACLAGSPRREAGECALYATRGPHQREARGFRLCRPRPAPTLAARGPGPRIRAEGECKPAALSACPWRASGAATSTER